MLAFEGGGGGGGGLIALEPPCGESPPSAKTFVVGETVRVRTMARQRLESSNFDFFICFSCCCRKGIAADWKLRSLEQELLDEKDGRVQPVVSIALLEKAVAFVLGQ